MPTTKKFFRAPKRTMTGWFVQCPTDASKRWQFSMHPHIFHECQHCGIGLGVAAKELTASHILRQASWSYKNSGAIESRLDEVCANPEPFFLPVS